MTIRGEGREPSPRLTCSRLFAVPLWRVSGNRGPAALPAPPHPPHLGAAWGASSGPAGPVILEGPMLGAEEGSSWPGRCLLNWQGSGPCTWASLVTRPGFRNKQNDLSTETAHVPRAAQRPLSRGTCGCRYGFCLTLAPPTGNEGAGPAVCHGYKTDRAGCDPRFLKSHHVPGALRHQVGSQGPPGRGRGRGPGVAGCPTPDLAELAEP